MQPGDSITISWDQIATSAVNPVVDSGSGYAYTYMQSYSCGVVLHSTAPLNTAPRACKLLNSVNA